MNVISDVGVKYLLEKINSNYNLKDIELDLSSNVIKYEGAEHISKAIIEVGKRHKRVY